MKKFGVIFTRCGYLAVEAETEDEALEISAYAKTDDVSWDDDWETTDIIEVKE